MCNSEDIKARLEDVKGYVYNEIHPLNTTIKKDVVLQSGLQKFKPSKHRKAYRIENNFGKRCYVR